jgi:transposase
MGAFDLTLFFYKCNKILFRTFAKWNIYKNRKKMGRGKSGHSGCCPSCGLSSILVQRYGVRKVNHFAIGEMEVRLFDTISFGCMNESCFRKTFTVLLPVVGVDEIVGRSRYTQSSKQFVATKLLNRQVSYNSFREQIREDFGGKTSLSSLHKWTSTWKVESAVEDLSGIKVLHTDEKHPSKKKRKSDKKFVRVTELTPLSCAEVCRSIASAGREGVVGKSIALHANLSDSNSKEAIKEHYREVINNGLDAEKVELVVTDMLPAYDEAIAEIFPNATHQYCVFHFIQAFNTFFKDSLKVHRNEKFEKGARKEAHKISFLLLKGQEKLDAEEQEKVLTFCREHATMGAEYALKEDIRILYATVETREQAYAYKDILVEQYQNIISPVMTKALEFFTKNFDKTIAFLQKGYFMDRTNNDAERSMRAIKRTQQTHYFLRKDENYIRKIRCVLGITKPIAA